MMEAKSILWMANWNWENEGKLKPLGRLLRNRAKRLLLVGFVDFANCFGGYRRNNRLLVLKHLIELAKEKKKPKNDPDNRKEIMTKLIFFIY